MANPQILTDCLIGYAGVDASGRSNSVELSFDATTIDTSVFDATGWKRTHPGAMSVAISVEGLIDYGTGALDPTLFSEFSSSTPTPWTFAVGRTAGDIAYLVEALQSSYAPAAVFDEALTNSASLSNRARTSAASSAVGRGYVVAADPTASRTTTLTSGTVEIAESDRLRMNVHIFGTSASGTVTPQIDWTRVGGGTSGTETGSAINPGSATVIDVAWPDAGNDLDVGVTLTVAGATFGYTVAAAAITT